MSESELISIDKSVSFTGGCQNKIGFVRTSSCNYDELSEIEGYSLNCHQWSCPDCAKVLKNQLLDRINQGLDFVHEFFFMTLTSSYREMDIKKYWNRFRVRMSYNYSINRFVWVMELTPPSHVYEDWKGVKRVSVGGLRHFHVLISFKDKIPSKDLIERYWYRATSEKAWQIHFERLNDIRSPAGYMSKYLTKSLFSGYKDKEHRVGFSQNFPKLKSNLEVKKGVYLPYDPRIETKESSEFVKMISNKSRYL